MQNSNNKSNKDIEPQEYKLNTVLIRSGRAHKCYSMSKSGVIKIDLSRTSLDSVYFQSLLSSSNITNITMDKCNLDVFPTIITHLTSLRQISLKMNRIREIPIEFPVMSHVETIYIDCNQITKITSSFFSSFPKLSKLSLKNNKLLEFTIFGTNSLIKYLDISNNQLDKFPENISNLTMLENLTLQGNPIGDSVPENISQLINLKSLNLSNCGLTQFPSAIKSVSKISRLNLSENKIEKVPGYIKSLDNLMILNISSNRLRELDENVCLCVSLEKLNISDNAISALPVEISALQNLKKINLSKNRFEDIHYSIASLDKLEHVQITASHLRRIESPFAKLASLVHLNLSGVDLRTTSSELAKFTLLTELIIDNCNMDNLEFISSHDFSRNLERLDANGNFISSLPASIGQYIQLKSLSLMKNRIHDLPETFMELENLQDVNMADNSFKEFPIALTMPKKLSKLIFTQEKGLKISEFKVNEDSLTMLTELDLSYNHISFLPEHSKWISNLQKLSINNNRLVELPSCIINAYKLNVLEAANNKLTSLPSQLCRLTRLTSWSLQGNLLRSPPMQLVEKFDIQTVLEHLKVLSERSDALFDSFSHLVASSLTLKQFKSFIPRLKLDEAQCELYNSLGKKDPKLEESIFNAMMSYKEGLPCEDRTPENVMQLMNRTGNKDVSSIMKVRMIGYSLFSC